MFYTFVRFVNVYLNEECCTLKFDYEYIIPDDRKNQKHMKNILTKTLIIILFSLSFWIIIYKMQHYNNSRFKKATETISFRGKIDSKYIDKNDHLRSKIKIIGKDKTLIYDLANDKSGLFEYVHKGDSVVKLSNSLNVRVSNPQKDTIFVLNFHSLH